MCLCPYLKISLTDLEAGENFTKNTRWPVSKYKLENKDKKGTLSLCYSSLRLSGKHLIMLGRELDPADDDTWDSLHPLSSGGTPHFRKAAPRARHLEIWTKRLSCRGIVSSLAPLPTDLSLLVLPIKFMTRKNSQGKEANPTTLLINNAKV